jgi:hypothetical protein
MHLIDAEEVASLVYEKVAHQFADLRVVIGNVEKVIKIKYMSKIVISLLPFGSSFVYDFQFFVTKIGKDFLRHVFASDRITFHGGVIIIIFFF